MGVWWDKSAFGFTIGKFMHARKTYFLSNEPVSEPTPLKTHFKRAIADDRKQLATQSSNKTRARISHN